MKNTMDKNIPDVYILAEKIASAIVDVTYECGLSEEKVILAMSKAFAVTTIQKALLNGSDREEMMMIVTDEMKRLNGVITNDMIASSIKDVEEAHKNNPALWN